MKKIRYFAIILAVIFLVLPISFISALEINYPNLNFPGAPQVTEKITLVNYIQYFFVFSFVVAGIIGVIIVAFYGLKILLSLGSPESIGEAKKNILGSFLGIGILMTAFIILQTINPQLINTAVPEKLKPGVYYIGQLAGPPDPNNPNGLLISQEAPKQEADISKIASEFTKLFYNCTPPGKKLLVWTYNKTNWVIDRTKNGKDNSVNTWLVPCSSSIPDNTNTLDFKAWGVKSLLWEYDDPGVYFYLTDNCTGVSSYAQKTNHIIYPFDRTLEDQQAKSMIISSGTETNKRYGVVLTDSNGECVEPIVNPSQGDICVGIGQGVDQPWPKSIVDSSPLKASFAYVLNLNPDIQNVKRLVKLQSDYLTAALRDTDIGNRYMFPSIPPYDTSQYKYNGHDATVDALLLPPQTEPPPPGVTILNGIGVVYNTSFPLDECGNPSAQCLNYVRPSGNFYVILYARNYDKGSDDKYHFKNSLFTCAVKEKRFNVSLTDLLNFNRKIYRIAIVPRR